MPEARRDAGPALERPRASSGVAPGTSHPTERRHPARVAGARRWPFYERLAAWRELCALGSSRAIPDDLLREPHAGPPALPGPARRRRRRRAAPPVQPVPRPQAVPRRRGPGGHRRDGTGRRGPGLPAGAAPGARAYYDGFVRIVVHIRQGLIGASCSDGRRRRRRPRVRGEPHRRGDERRPADARLVGRAERHGTEAAGRRASTS